MFYLPHTSLIQEKTESTSYDLFRTFPRHVRQDFLLNDSLRKGPPLQNKVWDVLVTSRFYPVILCANIEKGFLQIRIRKSERDCFRLHWIEATNNDKIEIYNFARLVFGLN